MSPEMSLASAGMLVMDQSRAPAYRLVRRPPPGGQGGAAAGAGAGAGAGAAGGPPRLDQAQQQVVDHAGGPLLVLAGPGTGKTTTIVAAVADRIENRGIAPERILVLTFSRKAAAELRERITARLKRTTREPLAVTFHSYAYALARREFVLAGDEPPRLLSAPEQLLEIRRMLKGEASDGGSRWPERLRPALATRGFAEEVRDLDGLSLRQLGKHKDRDDWAAAAGFLDRYAARFDLAPVPAYDYAEIVRIAAALLGREETRQRERGAYDVVLVDEYQDSDPAQESLLMALAGDGRELIAVGDPDQSIYAFRGADVRALTEFPDRFRTADGQPAPVVALRTCRRSGHDLLAASRRVARRLPAAPGASAAQARHRLLVPTPESPPGEIRILIADSSTQEAALVADTLRRAHLADGVPWPDMAVLVRSATRQVRLLRRGRALGHLGRLRPGRAVAAGQRGGRPGGRGRRPGPGRGAGAVRQGRALHRQHAARRARAVRQQPDQPGDRRRHPSRAGRQGRLRPHPDRAPVQGPGVGRRGGVRRPGGDMARPADARVATRRRRARRGRERPRAGRQRGRGRGPAGGQAAGRGAPAVLRGRHPGEEKARRHRGRRRGHRPAPVPVPDRAGG